MSKAIAPPSRNTTGLSPYNGQGESARVVLAAERAFAGLLAAALLLALPQLAAQTQAATPASTSASSPAHKPLHPRTRPGAAHTLAPQVLTPPVPVTPPEPALPAWPANDRPAQAAVVWDSQGLRIDAQNSSLQQILKDFSTASGVQIEGMGSDERVFGTYGPGQARDVLSQLLQGSSYNVIMIGDQGQGAPRQIVLSSRQAGDAQPAAANNSASGNDDDADVEEPPPPPPQPTPGSFRPGFQPRSPMAVNMQEQQREQQQREQQQRELQIQQHGTPQN